ncbi:MAG TPA: M23 family metallopeptidase [Vicinamibacterales bacterium]|nr:M23 family metallopeptidase [Vicinamibacterales bacterium]
MSVGATTFLAIALLIPATSLTVRHSARALRPGEVVVLTVAGASAPVEVRAFDVTWPVHAAGEHGWRALIGIDLGTRPGRHDVIVTSGGAQVTHPLDIRARSFPTRRLSVDPALVNPPPDAQARIEREAGELAAIWAASPPDRLWSARFVRPVPDRANSAFGTHSIFNGEPRSQHGGADFLSPEGRPVAAPNAGRVVIAADRYFSGNTVVLDHGQGLFSLLAHLSEIDVEPGDLVPAGAIVGKVGSTGRVTGAHLHWTVRLNGARVDPLSLMYVLGRPDTGR